MELAKSLALALLWVSIAALSDTWFKAAGKCGDWRFVGGLLCYSSTAFLAVAMFRREDFAWVAIVWNSLSLMVGIALSVYLFHERLSPQRVVASILLTIAIFLAR